MKTISKIILVTLFVLVTNYAFGNKFIEKYENMDNVTTISISKAMLELMSSNVNINGIGDKIEIGDVISKLDRLTIITSNNKSVKTKIKEDIKTLISKDYEELMRIKNEKDIVFFYIEKAKNNNIKNLLMTVSSDNETVVMFLEGNFTLEDIQNVTKTVNK